MKSFLEKSDVTVTSAKPGDPRICHLLQIHSDGDLPDGCKVALLGFPSDEGVKRNGGRPGAAEGPNKIREWLYQFTPDARHTKPFCELMTKTVDLGNVICSGDVAKDQENLADVVKDLLERNIVPMILGGGHETAFGHFLGYAKSEKEVSIVNIDAHADVRKYEPGLPHSGSPFRQAVEHESNCCRQYTVLGLNPASISIEHTQFIAEHGGEFSWKEETEIETFRDVLEKQISPIMLTMDVDALDQSFAPGVSAPNADGLDRELWLEIAYLAGLLSSVTSFEIVELNPKFDNDDCTARLVARTVWNFIAGLVSHEEKTRP